MVHPMHINYEFFILIIQLDCHTYLNILENIEHHINFKFDQFGCNDFQNQTTKKHYDIHQNALSNYQKWPYQHFIARIIIKELGTNLQPCNMHGKPRLISDCDFITRKKNGASTLDQRFDFVHNHILHARCHLPINYI
jgi:hypothetical protein